jgi:hypothetical protein
MKQYSKLFSLVTFLGVTGSILHAHDDRAATGIQWRSQGRDMARKIYGETSYAIYQPDMDGTYGTFNATVQYDQTFRNKRITECLFGPALVEGISTCDDDCGNGIVISGLNSVTGTATRGPKELMAENFLLPRNFRSTITFSPKIRDVVVDFHLYVGLDRWVNGLYFRLYGPVVWNKVTLKPSETVATPATATVGDYVQGFFDPAATVPTANMFKEALQYFGGCKFPGGYTDQSVSVQPLRFAKFSDCPTVSTTTTTNSCRSKCDDDCNSSSHHKTGFAELRGELGYNYYRENCRFLINLQAAAPTGTKVKAEYLLPAYVGNGHHWELGVGLGGAWKLWRSQDDERSFEFIVEADITHLFKAKQQRTFDLKCKPLSRYMLAEKLVTPPVGEALTTGTKTFDVNGEGEYAPVANFSTRDVKVSFGVQGDLVAMFNYTHRGFSWDLGYNFWALSSSKISLKCDDECNDPCGIVPFPVDTWVLKGDASIAGYGITSAGEVVFGLGATESQATIFQGVNATNVNNNIDTPTQAIGVLSPGNNVTLFAFNTTDTINTSTTPIFISIDDLDIKGAEQRGLSHKVFTHLSYTWTNHDRWVPYVGAGVSAEFGSHSGSDDCNTTTDCEPCPKSVSCALSKWAVEVKGGVSFH